jgi:hypothetical protein
LEEGAKRVELKLNSCVGEFHFLIVLRCGLYAYFWKRATNSRRESTGSPGKVLENALSSLTLSPEHQHAAQNTNRQSPFAVPSLMALKPEPLPQFTFTGPTSLNSSLNLEFPTAIVDTQDDIQGLGNDFHGKLGFLEEQLRAERRRSEQLEEQLRAERLRVMELESQLMPSPAWEIMPGNEDDYLN